MYGFYVTVVGVDNETHLEQRKEDKELDQVLLVHKEEATKVFPKGVAMGPSDSSTGWLCPSCLAATRE